MNDKPLTRRRILQSTAALAVTGMAGCSTSAGSSDGTATDTATSTHTESEGEHHGHSEKEHSHDTVSEPKQSREVLVNTARGEGTDAYHFKPHVTWVTVGGTVTWKLQSGTHTATAYHPGNDEPRLVPEGTEAWDSGTLSEKGETFEHTFDTEGVYHYFCKPHEQFGMLGTVIVGKPHLDDQRALQTIPENKPEEVRGKLKKLNEMVHSIVKGGHHEGETTTSGHHHEEDGHHEGETTTTESGHHHEEETTTTSG